MNFKILRWIDEKTRMGRGNKHSELIKVKREKAVRNKILFKARNQKE